MYLHHISHILHLTTNTSTSHVFVSPTCLLPVVPVVQDGSSSSTGSAVSFFEGSFVEALAAAADGAQRTEGRQLLLLWLHQKVGIRWAWESWLLEITINR